MGLVMMSILSGPFTGYPEHPLTIKGVLISMAIGLMWSTAAVLWNKAMEPKHDSSVASIILIVGMNPFIATIVSTIAFKEWHKLNLAKFGLGACLLCAGLFIVFTSKKTV